MYLSFDLLPSPYDLPLISLQELSTRLDVDIDGIGDLIEKMSGAGLAALDEVSSHARQYELCLSPSPCISHAPPRTSPHLACISPHIPRISHASPRRSPPPSTL